MRKNINGALYNQSVTIVEPAGEEITDCRNKFLNYDTAGSVVLAVDGTKPILGIAIIEAGCNDISGVESGNVKAGEDIDIQIKDIGYVIAADEIAKGAEITATAGGLAITAAAGDYVAGIALGAASKDRYCRVQIVHYQKNA